MHFRKSRTRKFSSVDHPNPFLEDLLLRAGRSSRHRGVIPEPDGLAVGFHPLCGSELTMTFREKGGVIVEIRYETSGCPFARASAMVLAELGVGRTRQDSLTWIDGIERQFQAPASGESEEGELDDLMILLSARHLAHRLPCLTLPWQTLAAALTSTRTSPPSP